MISSSMHETVRNQLTSTAPDHPKTIQSTLELLPDEVLLQIFQHLNGIDLLQTFYDLNYRLNCVLHENFQNLSFNFKSISKTAFDFIGQQKLNRMGLYISSLQLSNQNETPTQIERFFSQLPSIDRLICLKSLSLEQISNSKTLRSILEGCHRLTNLREFRLSSCSLRDQQVHLQHIIDLIWSLPNLNLASIGIHVEGQHLFPIPTVVCLSLRSITIENQLVHLSGINSLVASAPNLNYLKLSVSSFEDDDYSTELLPNLRHIHFDSLSNCNALSMRSLLENLPNLQYLTINLLDEILNGYQWIHLIEETLPELKHLRIQSQKTLSNHIDLGNFLNCLIDSYKTPFWIDDHRWFVSCVGYERTVHLFTWPHHYNGQCQSINYRSNHPSYDESKFYQSLTVIVDPEFFYDITLANVKLKSIKHLSISLPLSLSFWSIIDNFHNLTLLKVHGNIDKFQAQFQSILDRASNLITLVLIENEAGTLPRALLECRNSSVRQLDLQNLNYCFKQEDCLALSSTSLGKQCEKLWISVDDLQCIVCLVKTMASLRYLSACCRNERSTKRKILVSARNQIHLSQKSQDLDPSLEWLRTLLPLQEITRDSVLNSSILVWR